MSREHLITVDDAGCLQFIYHDELDCLSELGPAQTKRASHVEPTDDGQWTADMSPVGGPTLGPFPLRQVALDAEVAWLQINLLNDDRKV
jgi:hypothetical protein